MTIRLTRIKKEFTKEAQEKFDTFQDEIELTLGEGAEGKRDEFGKTARDYEELGVPVPENLKSNITEDSFIEFDLEKDYVTKESNYLANTDMIEDFDEVSNGTVITYLSDRVITVKESIEEIQRLINSNYK